MIATKEATVNILSRAIQRADGGASEEWVIEGLASTAGFSGDGILVGLDVLAAARDEYMENPILCISHNVYDTRDTVGLVTLYDVRDDGLFIRAMISKAEPDVWTKINEGIYSRFSISFNILDGVWDHGLNVYRATVIRMREISIVATPADKEAKFTAARSLVEYAARQRPEVQRAKEEMLAAQLLLCGSACVLAGVNATNQRLAASIMGEM